MEQYATRSDFINKRMFCVFFVRISKDVFEIEEFDDVYIIEDTRCQSLRISPIGDISNSPIKTLVPQSISDSTFFGYYVDYNTSREEAKMSAISLARILLNKLMTNIDITLSRMQSLELVLVKNKQ